MTVAPTLADPTQPPANPSAPVLHLERDLSADVDTSTISLDFVDWLGEPPD